MSKSKKKTAVNSIDSKSNGVGAQSSSTDSSLKLSLKQELKLLLTPCKTKEEFKAWIKYFLNLELPDVTVSRYSDTNPLDAIWEVYSICVLKDNKENIKELLFVAGRGSGKTLGMAIAELMVLLHDKRDVAHVGAIQSQAERCYNYQKNFLYNKKIKPLVMPPGVPEESRILEKANMSKSIFNIDGEKVTLEVLPCTLKACNGPHVPLVVVDEIDTVSGEGVKAFKEITGMLDSKGDKIALRVGISTRKSRYGLMNKQIENADAEGRTVRRWTAFEFTERCTDERSGTKEINLYVNQDRMETLTEEEFKKRDKNKQKEYVLYKGYEGCAKCPLFPICLTDAKKQTSKSPMLKTLDELVQKVRSEGSDWALAQLMNLKPSVEGIIYREFDEKIHVKTWNEMWEKLTGKEFPGVCTHDVFVKKCFSEDTEVLTQNGFKLFKDLTPYDQLASLDDDGKLIYEQPLDYISYRYSGAAYNLYNMIGGHGKQLDLIMTEDHNQVYVEPHDVSSGKLRYKKAKIQDLAEKKFYVPAVPLSADLSLDGYSPISYMTPEQYAAFMGLWLSEGSCDADSSDSSSSCAVEISQLKIDNVRKIDDLLNSIPWPRKLYRSTDKRDGAVTWTVHDQELHDHVKRWRYAVNKSIDRAFFDRASRRQMELMLEWLLLGDGAEYRSDMRQQPYYSTGSEKLANDVQELCFRLGYRTNLTSSYKRPVRCTRSGTEHLRMYRVHIHLKRKNKGSKYWYINNSKNVSEFSKRKSRNIEKIHYDGQVYCVTMPSGRLFVRRNGVIALSGNCHELQLPCFAGIDWGFSSPNTVVFFFIDKKDNVYIVRTDGMTHISTSAWIHHIKTKYHNMYRVQLYVPDQADQGAIQEMQKAGLPVSNNSRKEPIMVGIQIIKKLLKVPGSTEAKLFISKETCQHIISEFSMYHYKLDAAGLVTDDPDTEHDHWLDALRYPITLLLGKTSVVLGGGLEYDNIQDVVDSSGMYHKTPTPEEYAAINGIPVKTSNDEDMHKIGKIGRLSELEDDDDESSSSGQGGFLWSF